MKPGAENAFMKSGSNFFAGLVLCFSLMGFKSLAQGDIPVGSWRYHVAYLQTDNLTSGENTLFARGPNSLFYFGFADPSPIGLTKLDGLYAQNFTQFSFDQGSKTLVLAYPDGTLDMVTESRVRSISTIRQNSLITQKNIQKIRMHAGKAFLAAAFGIAILDLQNNLLEDAFLNIGPEGSRLAVQDVVISETRWYLATELGVFEGNPDTNLKDFRNWSLLSGPPTTGFTGLEILDGALFALSNNGEIYRLIEDRLEWIIGTTGVNRLKIQQENLYFSTSTEIFQLQANGNFLSFENLQGIDFRDFVLHGDGSLYLATNNQGVLQYEAGIQISAPGPSSNQNLIYNFRDLLAVSGRIAANGQFLAGPIPLTNRLEAGVWQPIPAPENVISSILFQGRAYYGTSQNGLWKQMGESVEQVPLPGVNASVTVSSLAVDVQGQLWIGLLDGQNRLFKITPNEEVLAVPVSGLQRPIKLLVDLANNLWILQAGTGGNNLRVFHEQTGLNRTFGTAANQGGLPAAQVLDMDLDLDGQLWIGTPQGVAYFLNAALIDNTNPVNGIIPLLNNRPLLGNQQISTVKIAPDNSKWLGTQTQGLWHISSDGSRVLQHFTAQNSPLPDNVIQATSLDVKSGELFIRSGTAALSYRGGSIAAAEKLESLKIFPNPVRPEYIGLLSIEGLTDFSDLKITNASGRVVVSLVVRGGKATWDLRDQSGNKVVQGVYWVYALDSQGRERVAGKFLVM